MAESQEAYTYQFTVPANLTSLSEDLKSHLRQGKEKRSNPDQSSFSPMISASGDLCGKLTGE